MDSFDAISLQEMIDHDIQDDFGSGEFMCSLKGSRLTTSIGNMNTMMHEDISSEFSRTVTSREHISWQTNDVLRMEFDSPGPMVNPQTAMPIPNHTLPFVRVTRPASSPAPADTPPTAHSLDGIADGKHYPKPAYSYSCLIAMALKNSQTGSLPVSEIYSFMTENFPYFKTAPNGWKNSVRHNLSLNKCFEKVEKPNHGSQRKGCLWAMNPAKVNKMEEEVQKWSRKDPVAIKRCMARPENLELLEKGFLSQAESLSQAAHLGVSNSYRRKEESPGTELNMLDGTFSLDSSLPDLNLQTDIWDELSDEQLHFTVPMSSDILIPDTSTMVTNTVKIRDHVTECTTLQNDGLQGNYIFSAAVIDKHNSVNNFSHEQHVHRDNRSTNTFS